MTKNINYVSHKKSKQKNQDGSPKLPLASALVEGEIAINFGKDVETLSIKNESGNVVTFSSDNYFINEKGGFKRETNPSTDTKVGLVNSLSQYYDTNIGKGAVIEGDGSIGNNKISASGDYSHAEGYITTASGEYSHAEGGYTTASGNYGSHAEGYYTEASGNYSHAEGQNTQALGQRSHAEGWHTFANNNSEHASGQYNVSSSASTEFGNSGNTLFSVGNGTAENARHNAFEIKQNGDIYIVNKNGQDVKLQDEIGNITVDQVLDDTTSASTNPVSSKAVYKAATDNELVWTNAFVALSGAVSAHTENTEIHVTATDKTAWNAKVDASAIANFFDDAKYEDSGTTKVINFYHGNTIKATIDASDFIVDGMVDDVRIENGNLVVDFNTASGKQDISIPLTDIFDPSNYYNKVAIDNLVGSGFTSSSITEVIIENEEIVSAALTDLDERKLDASAYTPTDLSNYYTKSETSGATEISTALGAKSDTGHTHVSNEVTAMTGYAKAASGSSIATGDSLNVAIGKLEAYVDDLNSQSETVAAALNDLNAKKVDTSLYYKKTETSGATEIQTALNGKVDITAFTSHTSSSVHMTTTEKTNLDSLATNIAAISGITATKVNNWDDANTKKHSHSNKTALDSITGNVGTMAYEDKTSYSSATQVQTALSNKADKTAVDDLSGQSETVAAALTNLDKRLTPTEEHVADSDIHLTSEEKLKLDTIRRRTRKLWDKATFISTLKKAVADQDLEKYGMRVGDYCTTTNNGKTYNYVIAGLNTMKGTSTPYRLNYNHIGIIVDTNDTHAWNSSNSTSTSQNTHSTDGTWTTGTAAAGYASCDLQYYLETTVLPYVEGDLGSNNIKSHYKLYSIAVNTSGYNRFGNAGGCSSSWAWYANQKICALSEVQVYGSIVWSSSGYDTGEACRQLDVFRVYNMNEIFEGRYPWLRDIASASVACFVDGRGTANCSDAAITRYVAALILFA